MMDAFFPPLIGGVLIGLSATLMLVAHGRVTGISGILGGLIAPDTLSHERRWRGYFVAGLVLGALPLLFFMPGQFQTDIVRSPAALIVAGLLVGVGTRLGSGCTSGHGVCGLSRFSPRSLVATGTFIASGAVMVLLVRVLFGGQV